MKQEAVAIGCHNSLNSKIETVKEAKIKSCYPVSTHPSCTKRRGKALYGQECPAELAPGWRGLQEKTSPASGRWVHQQGHKVPHEVLLPQYSTSSSIQEYGQGKGSLAQTCSDTSSKYSSSNLQPGASYATGGVFSLAFQKQALCHLFS